MILVRKHSSLILPVKYKDVERVLKQNGFVLTRQNTGSHRQFTATINGKKRLVTLAYNQKYEEVKKGTLGSIKRQSALDKNLFR